MTTLTTKQVQELIERLRDLNAVLRVGDRQSCNEAADALEQAQARIAELERELDDAVNTVDANWVTHQEVAQERRTNTALASEIIAAHDAKVMRKWRDQP